MIGLDMESVHDSLLMYNFSLVGHVSLDDKVRLGSQGASSEMDDLIQRLKYGKERRFDPPDDYRDHLKKLDQFKTDEYFDVKDFIQR